VIWWSYWRGMLRYSSFRKFTPFWKRDVLEKELMGRIKEEYFPSTVEFMLSHYDHVSSFLLFE
jgi:hypothetical protein